MKENPPAVDSSRLVPLQRCGECHHWQPLSTMSSLGECRNQDSEYFRKPLLRTNTAPHCFKPRDLRETEFLWCDTCKETVATNMLEKHAGHALFIGTSQFPVEDSRETTHAGD